MSALKLLLVISISISLIACQGMSSNTKGYNKVRKSLPNGFKEYGMKNVNKTDGHPVRSGNKSYRFELRAGDCGSSEGWSDCKNDRERHEMKTGHFYNEKWHSWSIYLPVDYPIIWPISVNLGQFHEEGPVVWMFHNRDGGLSVANYMATGWGQNHITRILSDEEMRAKWTDILVHVYWTLDKDIGFFKVYVNGETKPRYSWNGPTKLTANPVYHKFGIYRSDISKWYLANQGKTLPTQVVYFDDVNQGSTCEATTVFFNCAMID